MVEWSRTRIQASRRNRTRGYRQDGDWRRRPLSDCLGSGPPWIRCDPGRFSGSFAREELGVGGVWHRRVLLRLKVAGLIPEVKSHLIQMRQSGGHVSDALLEAALSEAGEHSAKVI